MRTWRVGSISMGMSLLFLGIFLLLSQILKWDAAYVLAGWWPVLLIVLGAEILVYLFLSKHEKPKLKYDFLSIIFVGIIGTMGIGFTVLQATGLMDHLHGFLNSEVRTAAIPEYNQEVGDEIKRIVVDSSNHPLTIETGTSKEISIFGTYRSSFQEEKPLLTKSDDYLFTKIKGDTLYITLKGFPEQNRWMDSISRVEATLVVPSSTSLEVSSEYQEITLKPRRLLSSWQVSSTSNVRLRLSDSENVTVYADDVERVYGEDAKWQYAEPVQGDKEKGDGSFSQEGMNRKSATLKLGSGDYPISITDTGSINVAILN